MKLLLDTHVLIWYVDGNPKLSQAATDAIRDTDNSIRISPASCWEIGIKVSIGKLQLNRPFAEFLDLCVDRYGFEFLPIEPKHALAVSRLPFPPNHRDPFDRLLVAQALAEGMELVSADPKLDAYGIRRVW